MKKIIKKILVIVLVYSIGIGFVFLAVARAQQIDNVQKKELSTTYENNR